MSLSIRVYAITAYLVFAQKFFIFFIICTYYQDI